MEIVAELAVNQEVADGIEAFVETCERFTPVVDGAKGRQGRTGIGESPESAERTMASSAAHTVTSELEIVASAPPPITDPDITVEVAAMGGAWKRGRPMQIVFSLATVRAVGENGFRANPRQASAIWSARGCRSRHAILRRTTSGITGSSLSTSIRTPSSGGCAACSRTAPAEAAGGDWDCG